MSSVLSLVTILWYFICLTTAFTYFLTFGMLCILSLRAGAGGIGALVVSKTRGDISMNKPMWSDAKQTSSGTRPARDINRKISLDAKI